MRALIDSGPSSFALATLLTVQIVGLMSAWLARLAEGSAQQTICQCLFLVCLAVVGVTTVTSYAAQQGGWFLCGTTLSVMVLVATWDLSGSARHKGSPVMAPADRAR